MKKAALFLIFLFAICTYPGESKQSASVFIALDSQKNKINPNIYGAFMEMLRDFVNGPLGIWSQDLYDRGFDVTDNFETPTYWYKYNPDEIDSADWQMIDGGFNQNGLLFQKIENHTDKGLCGISQLAYVNDNIQSDFYVWAKGSDDIELKLRIEDSQTGNILEDISLGNVSEQWSKYHSTIPGYKNIHKYLLTIYFEGKGSLELDEASLMPANNIDGVRKEYYDLFRMWKPNIMRYPGGGFADNPDNNWEGGIGDIDQRKAPIHHGAGFNIQRLDFGTDEFIKFCRNLEMEPHLVVNLGINDPQAAANWVEYCNGDTNTTYGKIRALNGNPEPYEVRYWEIGNEQWGDEYEMTQKYLQYYDAMKAKDPSIELMIDGNIWGKPDNFEILMREVGEKCQYYGWHWLAAGVPKEPADNSQIYKAMLGASQYIEKDILRIESKIKSSEYSEIEQAITEWWIQYTDNTFWLDSAARGASLESGLANAAYLQTIMKYSEYIPLAERTIGLCCIRNDTIKGSGEKKIYATPSMLTQAMLSNHSGTMLLESTVECDSYKTEHINGLPYLTEKIPYLNVVATRSADSVFISVLNRSLNDSINTAFTYDNNIQPSKYKVYQMYSSSFLDLNEKQNTRKIGIKSWEVPFNKEYVFPPHSLTILGFEIHTSARVENDSIRIFPNPAGSFAILTIPEKISKKENATIRIYNITGQLMTENNIISKGNITIDLSSFPTGVYNVIIVAYDEIFTRKIIHKN
ncbi:MAG: T9SS type A sorting domain-containing protein [Candidatus Kapaibacterium sp.]